MECHWRILYREEKRSDLERKDIANVDGGLEAERAAETGKGPFYQRRVFYRPLKEIRSWNLSTRR